MSVVILCYSLSTMQHVVAHPVDNASVTESTSGEMPQSLEETVFYVLIDWIGGLLGLIDGPGILIGTITSCYGVYEYLKDLKAKRQNKTEQDWKQEHLRRKEEKALIDRLKKMQFSRLFNSDTQLNPDSSLNKKTRQSPFIPPTDIPSEHDQPESTSHSSATVQRSVTGSAAIQSPLRKLIIHEQCGDEAFAEVKREHIRYDRIEQLISSHPWLTGAGDDSGNTLLHYAAILGDYKLAKLLLESGAKPDPENNDGFTPLVFAATSINENGHVVFIRLLESLTDISPAELSVLFHVIAQRRDDDKLSRMLMSPLIKRSFQDKLRFGHITADRDPVFLQDRLNSLSTQGLTLIHEAVIAGNLAIVSLLLEEEILGINEVDDFGNTPLHYAVKTDCSPKLVMIETLLLSEGVDINACNQLGETPMHHAVQRGKTNVLGKLLACKNLNPELENKAGDTPLFMACRSAARVEIIKAILDFDQAAEVRLENQHGQTPLHLAVTLDAGVETVQALLQCPRINTGEIRNKRDKKDKKTAEDLANDAARDVLQNTPVFCQEMLTLHQRNITCSAPF